MGGGWGGALISAKAVPPMGPCDRAVKPQDLGPRGCRFISWFGRWLKRQLPQTNSTGNWPTMGRGESGGEREDNWCPLLVLTEPPSPSCWPPFDDSSPRLPEPEWSVCPGGESETLLPTKRPCLIKCLIANVKHFLNATLHFQILECFYICFCLAFRAKPSAKNSPWTDTWWRKYDVLCLKIVGRSASVVIKTTLHATAILNTPFHTHFSSVTLYATAI